MALKIILNETDRNGFVFRYLNAHESSELYIKIIEHSCEGVNGKIKVAVFNNIVFDDEDVDRELHALNFPTREFSFILDLEGGNNILQGYEYLKTLPEFEGCEDC